MDIEFHYYITCITALRAGFKPEDAYILAYSSQYTDDNTKILKIGQGTAAAYSNYISQTSDITKPEKDLMRIYPVFHFMPGTKNEIESDSALRRDGKFHILNTIPDNSNARLTLKAAFETKDLYRIGIATHMYADTFAHQNFVGYYESFNSMKGLLEKVIPNVGHAEAKHSPDWPAFIWDDGRLIRKNASVDNRERFLTAAGRLFEGYRKYVNPTCPADRVLKDKESLIAELRKAIGDHDKNNEERSTRMARYKELIGKDFKDYEETAWFDETAKKKGILPAFLPWTTYEWKPNHEGSNWYRFQQAVKAHQWFVRDNILDSLTAPLELERW
jgi:hypothetical protein